MTEKKKKNISRSKKKNNKLEELEKERDDYKILAQRTQTYQPVFYEVPLLYEENLFNHFNVTIFVNADTSKRKQRVLNRGVSENYFKLMNNKQIKENIKKNKSTFTVNNNGSILNLRLNIIKLLNKL